MHNKQHWKTGAWIHFDFQRLKNRRKSWEFKSLSAWSSPTEAWLQSCIIHTLFRKLIFLTSQLTQWAPNSERAGSSIKIKQAANPQQQQLLADPPPSAKHTPPPECLPANSTSWGGNDDMGTKEKRGKKLKQKNKWREWAEGTTMRGINQKKKKRCCFYEGLLSVGSLSLCMCRCKDVL